MNRIVKLFFTYLLSFGIISFLAGYSIIHAEENTDMTDITINQPINYDRFLSETELSAYSGDEIRLEVNKKEITRGETAEFEIDAPKSALYVIEFEYAINSTDILPTQTSIQVNGESPFRELTNVLFESLWSKNPETPLDRYGNELPPNVEKVDQYLTKAIKDGSYRTTDELLIPLKEGKNILELTVSESQISIQSITLRGEKKVQSDLETSVSGEASITIEAENMDSQNDSSIRAGSTFDSALTPYDSKKKLLNFLDRASFKNAGQQVSYQVAVEEEGNYNLSMQYLQSDRVDFPVFMNVYLNGEVISESFQNYPVAYSNKYSNTTFVNQETGEPLSVYLPNGKNELTFELTVNPISGIIEETEFIMQEIQALSLTINNIIGNNPDRNRDINLDEYIPGIEEQLIGWADRLAALSEEVQEIAKTNSEVAAFISLNITENQLRDIASKPRKIASRVNELSTGTNSITSYLGNLLQEVNQNGISIDKIVFHQDENMITEKKGFFSRLGNSIARFVNSFGEQNYETSSANDENLEVWVNRPRQYIEIMQQMIDEEFTPSTGIKVDLSIMPDQNKLILANASGDAPDIASGINYALPFELAIRNALTDLSSFDDFKEVGNRFAPNLIVPGMIEDRVYALPETMNFYVLFYRKDILDSIGLEVPETMNDVLEILPALQQNGKNFFYPTAGMAGMKIFAGTMPIVYQNGGSFYGEYLGNTLLNEEKTIEGMRMLTDLFTIYNMPYDVPSFYQSFRDGSVPIGISDYGAYNLILNAAPEIANSWEIALMPGVEDENGDISRWSSGGAESDVIFSDSTMQDEAWEYLKWWTSDSVQTKFGEKLQVTYGEEYVWNTANLTAFSQLPWASNDKKVIIAQSEWIAEVPRVLGTYMLEREVSNAYNSVVLDGENLRNAIDSASKRINRETLRKLEEFGYIHDGEEVEKYTIPESKGVEQ